MSNDYMTPRQRRALVWFAVGGFIVWIVVPLIEALAD